MKLLALATLAATLMTGVSAHTRVVRIKVNGDDKGAGAGRYLRQPPTNDPVKDLTSPNMCCNVNGDKPVPNYVIVPAGSTITTEWFHDTPGDDIIAGSHKGPYSAYLAPAKSNGEGKVWVKISDEGNNGMWATEKLIKNRGFHNITIPSGLAPGRYLFRHEIIALHEAYDLYSKVPAHGAQFYIACIQIQVTGSGKKKLPSGVAFPGEHTDASPGILWDLYNGHDQKSYPVPGPAVRKF